MFAADIDRRNMPKEAESTHSLPSWRSKAPTPVQSKIRTRGCWQSLQDDCVSSLIFPSLDDANMATDAFVSLVYF